MKYTPHTEKEIQEMLAECEVSSAEDLFSDIKEELRTKDFGLPAGKSEFEVIDLLKRTSMRNSESLKYYTGGGFYDHYIPAVVDHLSSRPEFYTAYTPYQSECSQGTLQAIYEYQTAICRITEMEAANASVYDGGTALAESALMALRITKRDKVIIDACINPLYRQIIRTYLSGKTAAVILQNPNFFGSVQDLSGLFEKIHSTGALAIESVYPLSLGLFKTPGESGADIAAGEGQSLGNPLNFGGPYLGFIATRKKYIRHLPGRIAGATTDRNGKRGFVLTIQAREQHIKREKATSNICTNQNLCALRAVIFLAALGKAGFTEMAKQNASKAAYAAGLISKPAGTKILNKSPVFNEFTVRLPRNAGEVLRNMLAGGYCPGIPLGEFYAGMENDMLVCVTEKKKKEDIETFVNILSGAIKEK
jgi:glycine dehydrogenase subunit 1